MLAPKGIAYGSCERETPAAFYAAATMEFGLVFETGAKHRLNLSDARGIFFVSLRRYMPIPGRALR